MQVASNGALSFARQFTAASTSFPNSDYFLIAPFLTDISTSIAGHIFYRYSNDSSLLSEVGNTINLRFATSFNPALLFIATWYRVPEFGDDTDKVCYKMYVLQEILNNVLV